ncbi:MAG TPA: RagB/SusD family nutrient uptake outer membrane protein, partial [Arachidicoccus sp.]
LGAVNATTQQDILNAVMHERQVELCFEGGHRWFDLKRTNSIDTTLGAPKNEKTGWQPSAALYPIPYTETQLNPFLTQNPGYN